MWGVGVTLRLTRSAPRRAVGLVHQLQGRGQGGEGVGSGGGDGGGGSGGRGVSPSDSRALRRAVL